MTNRVCKPITVSVKIQPGSASAAQKAAWRKFWQKLISEVTVGEH